jgi:hypothetical protein
MKTMFPGTPTSRPACPPLRVSICQEAVSLFSNYSYHSGTLFQVSNSGMLWE